MRLNEGDHIVTAYAEAGSGPGWSNTPVWVVIRSRTHELRIEAIQPGEQSAEILWLYSISQSVHGTMVRAVRDLARRAGEGEK